MPSLMMKCYRLRWNIVRLNNMRAETIVKNVFKFDELSNDAKQVAIDWYRRASESDFNDFHAEPGTVCDGQTWQFYAELTDGRIVEGYAHPNGQAWAMQYASIQDYRLERNYKEILCLATSSLEQAKVTIELATDKLEANYE